jgi:competence protein ComEC
MRADLRLAVPVLFGWVAVGVLIEVPQALPWCAIALWVVAVVLLVVGARRRHHPIIVVLALSVGAAGLLTTVAAARVPERQPAATIEASAAGRHVTATLITSATVRAATPFDATITGLEVGGEHVAVAVPATVFPPIDRGASPAASRIAIGSTLRVSGTLVATDPGDDVAFRVFASTPVSAVNGAPWYLSWADGLRSRFGAVASGLPGDGGALLPGLSIGDTYAVSESLDAAMKSTSLSHLTAVSGANCAVVIALIMLAGARLGLPRGARIAASVIVLVGFVVLVTPEPSVLRAAVMATIVLAAIASGRPASGLPVLALASLVLLVIDPWLSHSYGFVLSVLATGGLLLLARPLAAWLAQWMPLPLAALIAIPLAAQLACQPVLILLTPSIPVYGVIANVLAEPAAPVATVLGLVACVLVPFAPALGELVAWVAWVPSAWIAAVARFFSGLPGSGLPWPGGVAGVALVAGITALALLLVMRVGGRRTRMVISGVLALTLVALGSVALGDRVRTQLSRPGEWQFAACDIGQGDSILVRSAGKIALVDTGPDPASLERCLGELGIDRIDLLILSHYDLDHVGGTAAVFGRVDRALVGPTADANDQRLAEKLAASGARVEHASRGLTGILGELRFEVLWPKEKLGGVALGNDASVTVRFGGAGECASGCLSGIFLGDLGEQPQTLLMAANQLSTVDVVKVAHHGSGDQNERLYTKLRASVALISVGADNTYGHPTDRLLGILSRAGTLASRTDEQGLILVSPRHGGGASVWTERPLPPGKLLHD